MTQTVTVGVSNNSVVTDNFNCVYRNLTNASGTAGTVTVSTVPVDIYGIVVNSHTSGVVKLWDSSTFGSNIITNSFSFATGSGSYNMYGISTNTALTMAIGGTADITIAYRQRQS